MRLTARAPCCWQSPACALVGKAVEPPSIELGAWPGRPWLSARGASAGGDASDWRVLDWLSLGAADRTSRRRLSLRDAPAETKVAISNSPAVDGHPTPLFCGSGMTVGERAHDLVSMVAVRADGTV